MVAVQLLLLLQLLRLRLRDHRRHDPLTFQYRQRSPSSCIPALEFRDYQLDFPREERPQLAKLFKVSNSDKY